MFSFFKSKEQRATERLVEDLMLDNTHYYQYTDDGKKAIARREKEKDWEDTAKFYEKYGSPRIVNGGIY